MPPTDGSNARDPWLAALVLAALALSGAMGAMRASRPSNGTCPAPGLEGIGVRGGAPIAPLESSPGVSVRESIAEIR
ncbi:hypothetical protein [Tautonia marina]|uniref:hypothetical protein n=1 Tax=Tautonia marina TaxID=2653855 RepID=UPI00126135F8|nr:hypothetical protein [Tautonia marina]